MSQPGSCGPALDAFYATLSDEQKEQHRKSCTLVFVPTDAQRAKFGSVQSHCVRFGKRLCR
jgi:hypothetical protein